MNCSEPLLSYFLKEGVQSSPVKFGVTWEKRLSLSPDIHSALSAQVQVVGYNFAASSVALDEGTKKSPTTECVTEEASVF